MPKAQQALTIGGTSIRPGERCRIDLPISEPYGHGRFTLPVVVAHGHQPGSRLFVSAAIHGDEINGVEVIRGVDENVRGGGWSLHSTVRLYAGRRSHYQGQRPNSAQLDPPQELK